jgi:diguanylate cyclase (GGDEF)-like protein
MARRGYKPDLILLDVEMPEMTGFEAIAILKGHEAWKDIPVVFLTGIDDGNLLPRALELGAADVIHKPFGQTMLQDSVHNYLNDEKPVSERNSVLIIDDQEMSITALSMILKKEYTIYTANNGLDGIKAAEKYLPDIILLDIVMSGMDGYAVIMELKKSGVTKNIPVIFITSLNYEGDEERGLSLGAVDYITKPFSQAIVKLRLANQIKMLEQLRVNERLSMYDQLTDLPNRRSFEIRLKDEWGRAMREQTLISVLVLDIDNFKNYNDTYGHQQGDAALQSVAKALLKSLKRSGDFAARWGGEEFIVLLPNTDSQGAAEVAEDIRECIEEIEIATHNKPATRITVSIGVNTYSQGIGRGGSKDEFISGADMALYDAKNQGRNRVCYKKDNHEKRH